MRRLIHEALIYSSEDEYASVLVPFLRHGIAGSGGAIAVTPTERRRLLERELGADADAVTFFDAEEWYQGPGAALEAWRQVLGQRSGTKPVRAVGEVLLGSGRDGSWLSYESLLNRVLADAPAWVICPYDARTTSEDVLAGVRRSHPIVTAGRHRGPSPEHFSSPELAAAIEPLRLSVEGGHEPAAAVIADHGDLSAVRRGITWPALAAGLQRNSVADLTLAATGLAAAAVDSGGTAFVRVLSVEKDWLCEIASTASSDGLNALQSSAPLSIGRMVSDRVELGEADGRLVVRFVFGPPREPRRRILAAANALFPERGFRGAGVNAIIAQAGVAKATFYTCFASKNELVAEWIRSPEAQRFGDVWAAVEAQTPEPADRLVQFFDTLADWLADDEFGAWPLLSVNELAGPGHAERAELVRALSEPVETFRRAAEAAGLADPDGIAAQLNLLCLGAITSATISRSRDPVTAARDAARSLVRHASPQG